MYSDPLYIQHEVNTYMRMNRYAVYTIVTLISFLVLMLLASFARQPDEKELYAETESYEQYPSAVFAGGCFWGVEFFFEQQEGVIAAVSGYTGGTLERPSYRDVSYSSTGHVEAVKVFYDPEITDYRTLARYFFEIHDPEQTDGQGPDIGSQYLSVIFYDTEEERETAEELIGILDSAGYAIATEIREESTFYPAELYHQDYYENKRSLPYCHIYTKRFMD